MIELIDPVTEIAFKLLPYLDADFKSSMLLYLDFKSALKIMFTFQKRSLFRRVSYPLMLGSAKSLSKSVFLGLSSTGAAT